MSEVQQEFGLLEGPKLEGAALAFVRLLREREFTAEDGEGRRGWATAAEVLGVMQRAGTEGNKRWLRELANASEGEIASGQKGYKLVSEMTAEEYNHFRNWMKRQADQMTARILRSDRVFYRRQAVRTGNGILEVGTGELHKGHREKATESAEKQ